tara:strand:+ start:2734 stop:3516 length:783 start_codon:yes stop_codon:yes gene_type:complete
MNRKGIILAGGLGTRLNPITKVINKQLLPIYNKPMIYFPLSVLMQIGVREILIISNPNDIQMFKKLLGNGKTFGININYKIQNYPNGIAAAYKLAEKFLDNKPSVLILGDNLFYGSNLIKKLQLAKKYKHSTIFTYKVKNPESYGVYFKKDKIRKIVEKPKNYVSNNAVVGVYFLSSQAPKLSKKLKYSSRKELEITDLNNIYLEKKTTKVIKLDSGVAWLDTGSFDGLLNASNFVMTIEKRQGVEMASLYDIAKKNRWI